jgi:hypothetical protein
MHADRRIDSSKNIRYGTVGSHPRADLSGGSNHHDVYHSHRVSSMLPPNDTIGSPESQISKLDEITRAANMTTDKLREWFRNVIDESDSDSDDMI